jgi:hypothetical protein
MSIVLILLGTVAAAILYRLGGCSEEDWVEEYPWVPLFLRKLPVRDMGVSLIAVGLGSMLISAPWWMWLICYALSHITLTTYHDTKPYNWMKPDDNFWLHGLVNGMAFLPLAFFATEMLVPLILRSVVMGLFMGVWCHWIFSTDYIEEWGRGGIIILTLLFLL